MVLVGASTSKIWVRACFLLLLLIELMCRHVGIYLLHAITKDNYHPHLV